MPLRRCLDCRTLSDQARCKTCRSKRKRVRNAHARALGPCPQDGTCWRCNKPARPGDPLEWGHLVSILQGGNTARPEHQSCNRSAQDRSGPPISKARRRARPS